MIRLELREMKHAILTHLGKYQDEISRQVEAEMDALIKDLDWGLVVKKAVDDTMRPAISEAIEDAIKSTVQDIVHKALFEDDVMRSLEADALKRIRALAKITT